MNDVFWTLKQLTNCTSAWLRWWNRGFCFSVVEGWPGADVIKSGSGSRNLRTRSFRIDLAVMLKTYLATSRLPLTPFLASPLTRSILDMILIHGMLKFTMEDMADMTPLLIMLG